MIRLRPSNSSNRIGGGGSLGDRRITEDSTWGGGRKFPMSVSERQRVASEFVRCLAQSKVENGE
jgi:hypothetical protein